MLPCTQGAGSRVAASARSADCGRRGRAVRAARWKRHRRQYRRRAEGPCATFGGTRLACPARKVEGAGAAATLFARAAIANILNAVYAAFHLGAPAMLVRMIAVTWTLAGAFSANSLGDTIYESATLGPTGAASGLDLSSTQHIGSRFSISMPATVTGVRGHLLGVNPNPTSLFAAIVRMFGDFPSPTVYTTDTLASAVFTVPLAGLSRDVSVPLAASLAAGDYAVIFGAGQFGATGRSGRMPTNNAETPQGTGSFFLGGSGSWVDLAPQFSRFRFVVEGQTLPEPSTGSLFLLGRLLVFRIAHPAGTTCCRPSTETAR